MTKIVDRNNDSQKRSKTNKKNGYFNKVLYLQSVKEAFSSNEKTNITNTDFI